MRIDIRQVFADDWITRAAGERLREMILDRIGKGERVDLDFGGALVASTSFFDEGIAKLADHGWTRESLGERLSFRRIHPRDREIMEELFARRERNRRSGNSAP